MKLKISSPILTMLILASCSLPVDAPPQPTALPSTTPQPTLTFTPAFTPIPLLTQPAISTERSAPVGATAFCDNPDAIKLINSFSKAIASKDGALLSSLVDPVAGMDFRFYRDDNVVNYDVEHAKFIFETTFQANWGLSFGNGESTFGSFQEIILPSLKTVFTPTAVLECNQLKLGGATYEPIWPYKDMNYYSVHFPGTAEYGGLDWQTWVVGIDMGSGKPLLAAFVHYVWEP